MYVSTIYLLSVLILSVSTIEIYYYVLYYILYEYVHCAALGTYVKEFKTVRYREVFVVEN